MPQTKNEKRLTAIFGRENRITMLERTMNYEKDEIRKEIIKEKIVRLKTDISNTRRKILDRSKWS